MSIYNIQIKEIDNNKSQEISYLNISPNKNGYIQEPIIISKIDYEKLSKYKWHINKYGYVKGKVNNKNWAIHRYIMIEILGYKHLKPYNKVDHINGIKTDNRRDNIRLATNSENALNKTKNKNASSIYYGVSKLRDKWRVRIKVNNKEVSFTYNKEIHAAYHYDLYVKENNITFAKLNNIKKPEDFILKINPIKNISLPKGIYIYKNKKGNECKNKYRVEYKGKYICLSATIEDAKKAIENAKDKIKKDRLNKILSKPILRNNEGQAIIELFNKNGSKIGETIVDDDDYYELIKNSVNLSNGYVHTKDNNTTLKLHRVIMKCYDESKVVDHINNNPLDNRKENLRITTQNINIRNKSKTKNSSSKYIGVSYDKSRNKWSSSITVDYKKIYLGRFISEEQAAKVRDEATKKYFGSTGKLNFTN
jgi:hypothetical protein